MQSCVSRHRKAALLPVSAAVACVTAVAGVPAFADDGGDASKLSAQQLADDAKKELLDAKSLHVLLKNNSTGPADARSPAVLDLALDQDGNCAGSLTMGTGGAKGGTVQLIKRGDELWMKPDTTFWKTQVDGETGELAAQVFNGRYVHGSADDGMLRSLGDTCDLNAFQAQLNGGPSSAPPEKLTKGKESKVDGTDVVPVSGRNDGSEVVLFITSKNPHRLVRATEKTGDVNTTMTLTDYNRPVPSATPSKDESVDVSELENLSPKATPPQTAAPNRVAG
ncbi:MULTISPECIES: hypothetical protein [unclassified Streptomyces]|uniref:hypothetical protein n=1 Tax=unclassified Streptomyces TaxID=2593676 RepID=UPI0022532DF9|nr:MULTISPECIES: hypothetical protein [unclassified Streptomyces]MCX5435053.1 hypothetical protein [Streptomyces sp. NBC_00063]WSE12892.1 hypothetical protein OG518_05995 [Streptomyces sp. NBC_01397]WUB98161.1 hypothetical protein OHO83_40850 [Streptomyces sp. NBC_00569]